MTEVKVLSNLRVSDLKGQKRLKHKLRSEKGGEIIGKE